MILVLIKYSCSIQCKVGVTGDEDPPVPIPNTEVKLISVENTWRVTAWEDRAMPTCLEPILLDGFFFIMLNQKIQ